MTGRGAKGTKLDEAAVRALCGEEIARWGLAGKRVLAIVPDHTRTAPIDLMFRVLRGADDRGRRHGVRRPDRARDAPADERGGDQPASRPDAGRAGGEVRAHEDLQPRLERSERARFDRDDQRGRGRRDLGGPDARAGRRHHQQAGARLRPPADHRADLPARGGRVLGRQQVPVPGDRRAGDPEHVPLAGRAHHQPVDHRDQVHARARGRRSGGGAGPGRAQVRQPGRRGERAGGALSRRARGDLGGGRRALQPDSRHLQRPRLRQRPVVRARRCTTSSGWAESAPTSWSRWSPTAARSSSTRPTSTRSPSCTAR